MENALTKRIGIPKTLVYFIDSVDWAGIFTVLGYCPVESDKSSYELFKNGFRYSVNDQCFPVKLYMGHVLNLSTRSDFIFIPQLVSVKDKTYSCPKIVGLPQMVEHTVDELPPILTVEINMNEHSVTNKNVKAFFRSLCDDKKRVNEAFELFTKSMAALYHESQLRVDAAPAKDMNGTIGVIGHKYALHDPFLNIDLFRKLKQMDYAYKTSAEVLPIQGDTEMLFGSRSVHWDFGKQMVKAAREFTDDPKIDGIIFVTYFGCGIDSFLLDIFQRELAQSKPFLSLSLDEHSGEAGIATRLEAFLDMISFKSDML